LTYIPYGLTSLSAADCQGALQVVPLLSKHDSKQSGMGQQEKYFFDEIHFD